MARRPRQQRIEAYGEFRATRADDSAARRMQALAGLGATVAGVAEQFGRAKAEELAPAQAQEAVEQAITVDEEGQKVFGEVPTRKGFGSEVFNREAQIRYEKIKRQADLQYAVGVQNDTFDLVDRLQKENSADIETFTKLATEGYQGLSAKLTPEAKLKVDAFFKRTFTTASNSILKEQNKIRIANAKTESAKAGVVYENQQSILAAEGMLNDLAKSIQDEDLAAKEAGEDVINLAEYYKTKEKRMSQLRLTVAVGEVRRGIINNEEIVDDVEKISKLDSFIKDLKKQTVLKVADPENPQKKIAVNEQERKTIISAIESEAKDYKDLISKLVAQNTLGQRIEQVANYQNVSEYVLQDDINEEEKLVYINTKELNGEIKTEQASILRRYVNSKKALNATTNNSVYGEIIDRIYGLNADLSLQANNADYLEGVQSIDEFIKEQRTVGNLNRDDELKLNREMRNLTAAKKAGALAGLSARYGAANRIINDNSPPELRNDIRARIFERVQDDVQNAEEAGEELKSRDVYKLWEKYALSTSTEVIDEERQRSKESIRDVLSRTQVTPSAGAVIIKFDAQGNRI